LLITLEMDSDTPLYEQLRNQIIIGIATGQLAEHERLPTVRQLAQELGVNVMTVNKAYAWLKQEGYIVIDRRHGAKVSPRKRESDHSTYEAKLERQLELIIAQATINGVQPSQFQALCAQMFARMAFNK